jgi:hypothetical protein
VEENSEADENKKVPISSGLFYYCLKRFATDANTFAGRSFKTKSTPKLFRTLFQRFKLKLRIELA